MRRCIVTFSTLWARPVDERETVFFLISLIKVFGLSCKLFSGQFP